jgi:hypothetical protein
MSETIQHKGSATQLFSSALFCLWLSTASLVVWIDMGAAPGKESAQVQALKKAPPAPVQQPQAATPGSDGEPDAA